MVSAKAENLGRVKHQEVQVVTDSCYEFPVLPEPRISPPLILKVFGEKVNSALVFREILDSKLPISWNLV